MSRPLQLSEWVSRLPFAEGVRAVAFGGESFFAVDKPVGIRSHPNQSGRIDTGALLAAPYSLEEECYHLTDPAGGDARVYLIHRLDAPTSGLVLLAVDAGVAAALRGLFRERAVRKTYQAVVFGVPRPAQGRWTDPITRRQGGGAVRVGIAHGGGAVPAATRYRLQSSVRQGSRELSGLELQPETGRTHQLRVHCAAHGLPILGDQTYGDFKGNRAVWDRADGVGSGRLLPRLYLHAARLALDLKWNGKIHHFEAVAATPPEFTPWFAGKGSGKRTAARRFRRP